jgi:metal-responsive CopG/Arc/MetJ family transcriptional regulator
MKVAVVTVRISIDILDKVDRLARVSGRKRSEFIRHALRFCLANELCLALFTPKYKLIEE